MWFSRKKCGLVRNVWDSWKNTRNRTSGIGTFQKQYITKLFRKCTLLFSALPNSVSWLWKWPHPYCKRAQRVSAPILKRGGLSRFIPHTEWNFLPRCRTQCSANDFGTCRAQQSIVICHPRHSQKRARHVWRTKLMCHSSFSVMHCLIHTLSHASRVFKIYLTH